MSENTHLMREMLNDVRRDIDDLKDDLQDVKNITGDNNKRLNYIENKMKD